MRASFLLFLLATSLRTAAQTGVDSANIVQPGRPCSVSVRDFGFTLGSCECEAIYTQEFGDTLFIELAANGGYDLLGKLIRIEPQEPGHTLVQFYQNRMYTSSMGPDPVYSDWRLYTSPKDTLRYDAKAGGFYLDTISEDARHVFPEFQPKVLLRQYRRQVEGNRQNPSFPGIALWAQHLEFKRNRHAAEIVELSDVELHRVLLEVLDKNKHVRKVLVFVVGHSG